MHRRVMVALIAPLALLAGVACSGSDRTITPPVGTPAQLAGSWAEYPTFPGSALVMNLTTSDSVVTGTGSYAIEAGRSGTLTVRGLVTATQVSLDLAFDFGPTAHFAGLPPADSTLTGDLQYFQPGLTSPPSRVNFRRLH